MRCNFIRIASVQYVCSSRQVSERFFSYYKARVCCQFFLPKDLPSYADTLTSFALTGKEDRNSLSPEQAIQIVENLSVVDASE